MTKSNKKSKSLTNQNQIDGSITNDIPIVALDLIKDFIDYDKKMRKYTNKLLYEKRYPLIRRDTPIDIINLIESFVGDIKIQYRWRHPKTKSTDYRIKSIDKFCQFHHTDYGEFDLINQLHRNEDIRMVIRGHSWRYVSVCEPIETAYPIVSKHALNQILHSLADERISVKTRGVFVEMYKSIEADEQRRLDTLNRKVSVLYRGYRCFHCLNACMRLGPQSVDNFQYFDDKYIDGDVVPIDGDN